jgi:hypothetical protein
MAASIGLNDRVEKQTPDVDESFADLRRTMETMPKGET